jgi:hypothetical protein
MIPIDTAQAPESFDPFSEKTVCKRCGEDLRLRIIIPSFKPGYDERLYECTVCRDSETVFLFSRLQ